MSISHLGEIRLQYGLSISAFSRRHARYMGLAAPIRYTLMGPLSVFFLSRAHVIFRSCAFALILLSPGHRSCPGEFCVDSNAGQHVLDLTESPPLLSCNHRCGQGDYGEIFTFETSLTFDLSDIDPVCAHRSVATRLDLERQRDTAIMPGDCRHHYISHEQFLRGRVGRTTSWLLGFRLGLGHGMAP